MRHIIIILLSGLLLATNGYAVTNKIPKTCTPLPVRGESIVFNVSKATVFLIHNLSNTAVWLIHPIKDASASAGWNSLLQSDKWSALILNQDKFELTCIESKPGHEQQVACENLISICQCPDIKVPESENITYWAGENKNLSSLVSYIGGRGLGIPAHFL